MWKVCLREFEYKSVGNVDICNYIFVNCLEFSSTLIFQTNLGKQVNCGDKKKNSCAECADFTRDDWCGGIDCKWDYPSELCVPKGNFTKNGLVTGTYTE